MKTGKVLIEALAIVAVALVLGTGVHLLRPDAKQRSIAFVGKYTDAMTVPVKKPPVEEPPVEKPQLHYPESVFESVKTPPPVPPPGPAPASPAPASPPPATAAPVLVSTPSPAPAGPVRECLLDEIQALHKDESIPFIDARRTAAFEKGHLPRARSLSVWEADCDAKIEEMLKELPDDLALVIYCGGGDCNDSHMLADKLKIAGYKDLRIYKGGFSEWKAKGLPVEGGDGAADGPAPEGEGQR